MADLIQFADFHRENDTIFQAFVREQIYRLLRRKKFIAVYYEGTKYFIFLIGNKVRWYSEFQVCLILSSLSFIGAIAIRLGVRKLSKQLKLRRKIKRIRNYLLIRKINKYRGGQDFVSPENESDSLIKVTSLAKAFSSFHKLSKREQVIQTLFRKCIKKGSMYRITDPGLVSLIAHQLKYNRKDAIRIISSEVFALAIIVSFRPGAALAFRGTSKLVGEMVTPAIIEYLPVILALGTGLISGISFSLNGNVINFLAKFVMMLVRSGFAYESGIVLRLKLLDCSDFVQELSSMNIPASLDERTGAADQGEKIFYTREKPGRHDTYLSTEPGQQLHHQLDIPDPVNIQTEGGTLQEVTGYTSSSGKKSILKWSPEQKEKAKKLLKKKYIPLKYRTRTLADLQDDDTTSVRNSVKRILDSVDASSNVMNEINEL